jgi:hypothetical protein
MQPVKLRGTIEEIMQSLTEWVKTLSEEEKRQLRMELQKAVGASRVN